jgi:hypothetical protein
VDLLLFFLLISLISTTVTQMHMAEKTAKPKMLIQYRKLCIEDSACIRAIVI